MGELETRCAFKDTQYRAAPDTASFAKDTAQAHESIVAQGFWRLVKVVVRKVLPEERQRGLKTTYLTGSGIGGAHAALVSMWLKKVDDTKYEAYVIAGVGWQCFARSVLTADMDPWSEHPQIHTYSHVMDTYMNLDRPSGQVCYYGKLDFTKNDPAYSYCQAIVGYT